MDWQVGGLRGCLGVPTVGAVDDNAQRSLLAFRDEVVAAFGDDLLSVALFGSAAAADFVPGQSDLNVAIVVRKIEFKHLEILGQRVAAWHRQGVATPILLDPDFLDRAADVFPMEFRDIRVRHRVLWGADPFSSIEVAAAQLRLQLEQEARGKLLRLRLAYVETGGEPARVEQLLLRSVRSFIAILRALVPQGEGAPLHQLDILARFEASGGLRLPGLRHVLEKKLGLRGWGGTMDEVFRQYLADVEALVRLVDGEAPRD